MLGDPQPSYADLQSLRDQRDTRFSGSIDDRRHIEIAHCTDQFLVEQPWIQRAADSVRRHGEKPE
jgi:hypothetical protein